MDAKKARLKICSKDQKQIASFLGKTRAEPTGLEPATSSVTGRRSNQLSYGS